MLIDIDESVFLPCYRHLLPKTIYEGGSEFYDIELIYGGRDSGKSRHTAMQLVLSCLSEKYFKCLLIRKVLNTVGDSQFSLIQSVCEEWGISHLFKFNRSRLEIICKNGNGFYGRGLDDVGRIKSFNNPSHCWIEEGNQITNEDFVVVLTSLRANQDVKTWFTFNPECDVNYTDFWLYQDWFSHTDKLSWTWDKKIEVEGKEHILKIRATHTTYKDNPYCKPQRIALYESYKGSKNNEYWYQTYTLGRWGYRRTGGEFWSCFDSSQHVKKLDNPNYGQIHVTIDINRNPYISIQFWQIDINNKRLTQVNEIAAEHPNNTMTKAAYKVIQYLESINYMNVVYVYGDPSGNNGTTVDDNNASNLDKFMAVIRSKYPVHDMVQKSHPKVSLSGSFINEIYESNFEGWSIEIADRCVKSIEDYQMAKMEIDGTMLKKRVKNPDTGATYEQYGHMSDAKRYFITTALADVYERYKERMKQTLQYIN